MTECERLVQNGFITEEFLKEEVRDEYLISSEMKKVWAIQLELLASFIDVCEKKGLSYCVSGGTMIGAIRHKGYIPWDDDIDVTMPRDDYDLLIKNPQWFTGSIALHLPSNKEKYYEGWARIHNINTAVLYDNFEKEGSKQGIYIDVFPFDYFDNSRKSIKRIKKIWLINVFGHAFSYNLNKSFLTRFVSTVMRTFHLFNCEKAFKKVNLLACGNKNSNYYMSKMAHVYGIEKQSFPVEDYLDTIKVDFEFLSVCVPAQYDKVLRRTYGDYMVFPPVEKRGCWHKFVFDCDHPFSHYNK